jgi:chromate reductase, NAD(P)H dehydrogenase (quinone)
MTQLLGISGSLRKGSFNTALLRAAAEMLPAETTPDVRTLHGVPLYDADLETSTGIPPMVAALKDAFAAADGVVLSTPEHNNSIPGVFKNGIDWLSRPPADVPRMFAGKCIAVIGASAGGFGTILSQNAWLPVLRTLGTRPWFGSKLLARRV